MIIKLLISPIPLFGLVIVLHREDFEVAKGFPSEEERRRLYIDLASAAESGWDFSSRWFEDGRSIGTIRTTQVGEEASQVDP